MSGRCVELREMSPGGREMATSGGEREKRQANFIKIKYKHQRTRLSVTVGTRLN